MMYDLTVEEVHTFAVGDGNWVVHNQTTWCGHSITSTKWTSSEPNVANLANLIEDHYPGLVVRVNYFATHSDGRVLEMDIELSTAIIEVKDNNGSGLTRQIRDHQDIGINPSGLAVFGFATRMRGSAYNSINAEGGVALGPSELPDLLTIIAP